MTGVQTCALPNLYWALMMIMTILTYDNEAGYYMNWSHHVVTVLPSLQNDITLRISGRNVNEIKDHLWCVFEDSLKAEVDGKFAYED